ncbi:MAG: hypothetical protein SVM86_03900 [Candidatus Cloacimonadota bacterium]|nr:hypothetical protein [Candidatus Cloacimonadota bacterium]
MRNFVVCFLILALFIYLNATTVNLLNQYKIEDEQRIITASSGNYFAKRGTLNTIHRSIIDNYEKFFKTKTLQQEKRK